MSASMVLNFNDDSTGIRGASVEDAAESAKDVGAKLAIPIHYGLYEGTTKDAVKFKELLAGHMDVSIFDKQK